MNLMRLWKATGRVWNQRSPIILAGMAIGGTVGTVIFSIRGTTKAHKIVESLYEEHSDDFAKAEEADIEYSIPKGEIAKAVLPAYIPAIGMFVVTTACIVGSVIASERKYALLEGLYSTAEIALSEYQDKVVQKIGEKKELAIRDEIAEDHVKANPITTQQIVFTGSGDTLFYDDWSGRYFKSDYEKVRRAVISAREDTISYMSIEVNDVYGYLGLPPVGCGRGVGFNVDHPIEFTYSTMHADDMTPCTVITFRERPTKDI